MGRMTGIVESGRWSAVEGLGKGSPSWERHQEARTSVAKVRYQLKLTQTEFAKAVGLKSVQQVSTYETGKNTPSIKNALKIIEYANAQGISITLDQFYRGEW